MIAVLMSQTIGSFAQFGAQVRQVQAADIGEFDVLEIAPDAFIGVEVGRVAGQTFQVDTLRAALGQEVAQGGAVMSGQTLPGHQQLARELAQQVLEEAHNGGLVPLLGALHRLWLLQRIAFSSRPTCRGCTGGRTPAPSGSPRACASKLLLKSRNASRLRRIQSFTAAWLTPRAVAMSFCGETRCGTAGYLFDRIGFIAVRLTSASSSSLMPVRNPPRSSEYIRSGLWNCKETTPHFPKSESTMMQGKSADLHFCSS